MQLNSGEQVAVKAKKHWMFFFYPVLLLLICLSASNQKTGEATDTIGGFAILWLLYRIARYFCDEIVLTNQKVHALLASGENRHYGSGDFRQSQSKQNSQSILRLRYTWTVNGSGKGAK